MLKLKNINTNKVWEEHLEIQQNLTHFIDHNLILTDQDYVASKKILDIGCGYGHHIELLAKQSTNKQFLGIDNDALVIEQAKHNTEAKNTNYTVIDINQKKSLGKFDCILTKLVLQHLPSLENYLEFCYKNLKKRGCIFIIDACDELRRIIGLADELKTIYNKLQKAQKNKGSNRQALLVLPNIITKHGFQLEKETIQCGFTDREISKYDLFRLYQLNLCHIYNKYKIDFNLYQINQKLQKWYKNPKSYGSIACHFLKLRKI